MRSLDDARSATRAVVLSAASVLVFATFAAMPGSPFQPAALPTGYTPGGPFVWLARSLRLDRLSGSLAIAVGVGITLFAIASFLLLLWEAWRGNVSLRAVLALVVAYHVVILFLPVLFSRDVYSYAFYGRIVGIYRGNPYVQTPLTFSKDPLWGLLGPKWVDTPAVYGPLFTSIAGIFARWFGSPIGEVDAFRLLAIVASLATVFVTAWTSRELWPSRAPFAVVAFGANPVILFHSVASAHNDLLVALSVIVGLSFLMRGKELPAVASLTLGTLIKASGALPLLLLIVYCVARRPPEERRRAWFSHAGLAAGLALLFAMPYLQLHDPTFGMLELAHHEGWLAASLFFQRLFEDIGLGPLGVVVRIGFAIALIVGVWLLAIEVWRRDRELSPRGNGAAWGWALLMLMLLGPVLVPWYVVWAMPLVWLLPRAPRSALIGVGVFLAVAQWATESVNYPAAFSADLLIGRWVISPVIIGLIAWMLADLRRRLREGRPLECEEEDVAAAAGGG
ncbi:MAG: hypothetical protein M3P11_04980 [Actinomycetota bacterium]|nr:hypothetical protein [Actinomycetota bacterium]